MTNICFHLGLPKTGTTFLQECIFRKYNALGEGTIVPGGEKLNWKFKDIIRRKSPDIWKKKEGRSIANEILRLSPCERIIYSSGVFTDPPFWNNRNITQNLKPEELILCEHLDNSYEYVWSAFRAN